MVTRVVILGAGFGGLQLSTRLSADLAALVEITMIDKAEASGLTDEDGWIGVDPATLETRFPDVFAIGDVANAPVPRAGSIAECEANTVAEVLLHPIGGGPEPEPFPGIIVCSWRWVVTGSGGWT